jgi:hypothetical protein
VDPLVDETLADRLKRVCEKSSDCLMIHESCEYEISERASACLAIVNDVII